MEIMSKNNPMAIHMRHLEFIDGLAGWLWGMLSSGMGFHPTGWSLCFHIQMSLQGLPFCGHSRPCTEHNRLDDNLEVAQLN